MTQTTQDNDKRDRHATGDRRCEELLCQETATHVLHDDMGVQTDVCDEHAGEFSEERIEPITGAA